VQRPSFALALAGQGQLVLANLSRSNARLEVAGNRRGGQYFVLDADKKLLLTEITSSGQGRASIRVPPGKYRIRKREDAGSLVMDVAIGPGQVRAIDDAEMARAPYEEQARKGEEGFHLAQEPQISLGIRSGLRQGISAGFDLRAAYRVGTGSLFLQPQVDYVQAHLDENGWGYRHTEVSVGLAAGVQRFVQAAHFALGVGAALVFFDDTLVTSAPTASAREYPPGTPVQPQSAPEGLVSIGFQSGFLAQAGWRLSEHLLVDLELSPGMVFYRNEGSRRAAFVFGAALGLSYTFR
jgi:hypothetical protein